MFRIYKINNSLIFVRNNNVAVWNQNNDNFELDIDNINNIKIAYFNTNILEINQLLGYHENEYTIIVELPYSKLVKLFRFIKSIDIEDVKKQYSLNYLEPLELIYEDEELSNELLRIKLPEYFY